MVVERTSQTVMIFRHIGRIVGIILFLAGMLWLIGCGEEPELPANVNTSGITGSNDTSYVRIGPDWDHAHGYNWTHPEDIQVGRDGLLYIVDYREGVNDSGRVVQMTRSGNVIRPDLFANVSDTTRRILGIGQDSKLNMYMVNGSDRIYAWNQYVADVGIRSIITEFYVLRGATGDTDTVDVSSTMVYNAFYDFSDDDYVIGYEEITDPDSLAPLEQEYLFYVDSTVVTGVEFTDVSSGVDGSEKVYVSDRKTDRVIELRIIYNRAIILDNGGFSFTYKGLYEGNDVATYGASGQGRANNPTSVVSEAESGGNTAVYFTQTWGSFRVHKVVGSGQEWFFEWAATPRGDPEVIQLDYFDSPQAIAVAENDDKGLGLFFVADSAQNRVPAFHANGFFFLEVAADEQLVDLYPGETLQEVLEARELSFNPALNPEIPESFTAANDTTLKVLFEILDGPMGVATIEGVVYVADSGNDRILRFKRSDSDSYLPEEGD